MIIAGAAGHAQEVLEVFLQQNKKDPVFFDDTLTVSPALLFNRFQILKSFEEAEKYLRASPEFILGTGSPKLRRWFAKQLQAIGGKMCSVIAVNISMGSFNVSVGKGVNIMNGAFISNNVSIGEGALINARAMIHHDSCIGNYCEIGPASVIPGKCCIGEDTVFGAGVVLRPNLTVGSNVIIGAGSVVIQNIPDNVTAAGVPARIIKQNKTEA